MTGPTVCLGMVLRAVLEVIKTMTAHAWQMTIGQTDSGSNVSTNTVRRELREMGFHGRAAAHKPKITMHNAKHRLEWCKAHCYWTLEQWKHILWSDDHDSPSGSPTEESRFGRYQENATCLNA